MKTIYQANAVDLLIARSRRLQADAERRFSGQPIALHAPSPMPVAPTDETAQGYSAPGVGEPGRRGVRSFDMS